MNFAQQVNSAERGGWGFVFLQAPVRWASTRGSSIYGSFLIVKKQNKTKHTVLSKPLRSTMVCNNSPVEMSETIEY